MGDSSYLMSITLSLSPKLSPFPYAAVAVAAYTGITVSYDDALTGPSLALGQSDITTEDEIVKRLAELGGLFSDSTDVGLAAKYFTLAASLRDISVFGEIVTILDSIDDRLAFRTFLVGQEPTAADWIVWGTLKGMCKDFLLPFPRYKNWFV